MYLLVTPPPQECVCVCVSVCVLSSGGCGDAGAALQEHNRTVKCSSLEPQLIF